MPKAKWKHLLSYWFDNQLAKGPLVLISWLGIITFLLVLLATLVALFFNIQPIDTGFKEVFWDFLFQALTPNPFDVTAPGLFLIIMLFITLLSLLMVSILIGILTTSIENRINDLRRGRSLVIENEHTVILGWSNQIFTIISELIVANENRKEGAVIVIMANQDKVEMDEAIRARIHDPQNTRIICRSGTPMDLDDLEIVSPHAARAIIVLPPEGDNPDSYVIKTLLAIVNNPRRHPKPYHVVTQITSEHNLEVVRMIGANDDLQPILTGDQIARMVAQTSRQSGLSAVYTELLNFGGCEIYFQPEPRLVGKSYGEALMAYDDSAVIGLKFANGDLQLNPGMDTRISSGDIIVAISEDDDTIKLPAQIPLLANSTGTLPLVTHTPRPEKGLILGWNSKVPIIIEELENYVAPGSELLIVSTKQVNEEIIAQCEQLKNQRVTFRIGDSSDRQVLNQLGVENFQHIIVLAYDDLDEQSADAETMVTLLHLRKMTENKAEHCFIVSEMLDLRNRRLAEVANIDDFIVSDHLISLMLTQFSENSDLYRVFSELFDATGPELYFKPVSDYVEIGKPISYRSLVDAARQHGETAIGYRILGEMNDLTKTYGVYTNPKKSQQVTFSKDDKVVLLAEN
jgi:voltage-gated potassium channel Kch